MSRFTSKHQDSEHGPQNAGHELRLAYQAMIEAGVTFFWDQKAIAGVHADEFVTMYKTAFNRYRDQDLLAAERWARAVKHLERAYNIEAKLAYLEPRINQIPYIEETAPSEFGYTKSELTTSDLLSSLEPHIPTEDPLAVEQMRRHLSRAKRHLEVASDAEYSNPLLRAMRIHCAYEYGRVIECMTLAVTADREGERSFKSA